MYEVHIYIETDSTLPQTTEKQYAYVLECRTGSGETRTREGFGKMTGTYHQAVLAAVIEAMGRLNQSCEVHLHSEDVFVLSMLEGSLSFWAGNGFLTKRGRQIANREQWQQVWELSEKQLILTEPGSHSYSAWLASEMEKRKEKEDV